MGLLKEIRQTATGWRITIKKDNAPTLTVTLNNDLPATLKKLFQKFEAEFTAYLQNDCDLLGMQYAGNKVEENFLNVNVSLNLSHDTVAKTRITKIPFNKYPEDLLPGNDEFVQINKMIDIWAELNQWLEENWGLITDPMKDQLKLKV